MTSEVAPPATNVRVAFFPPGTATPDVVPAFRSSTANAGVFSWPAIEVGSGLARANAERIMEELKQMPVDELRRRQAEFNSMSRGAFLELRRQERLARARTAAERAQAAADRARAAAERESAAEAKRTRVVASRARAALNHLRAEERRYRAALNRLSAEERRSRAAQNRDRG